MQCLVDERAEAPTVGIQRDVMFTKQIVELKAVGFLKHPSRNPGVL